MPIFEDFSRRQLAKLPPAELDALRAEYLQRVQPNPPKAWDELSAQDKDRLPQKVALELEAAFLERTNPHAPRLARLRESIEARAAVENFDRVKRVVNAPQTGGPLEDSAWTGEATPATSDDRSSSELANTPNAPTPTKPATSDAPQTEIQLPASGDSEASKAASGQTTPAPSRRPQRKATPT